MECISKVCDIGAHWQCTSAECDCACHTHRREADRVWNEFCDAFLQPLVEVANKYLKEIKNAPDSSSQH